MGSSLAGLRRVRAVTKVVGRRTALRYLAVGAGVSVLAACGNGSGQAGSSGPVGHAVSTFVRGKWRVHAMRDDGGELPSYVVHITAGKWMVGPYVEDASLRGAAWEWSGRWVLRDSKLTLHGPWRPGGRTSSGNGPRWTSLTRSPKRRRCGSPGTSSVTIPPTSTN